VCYKPRRPRAAKDAAFPLEKGDKCRNSQYGLTLLRLWCGHLTCTGNVKVKSSAGVASAALQVR